MTNKTEIIPDGPKVSVRQLLPAARFTTSRLFLELRLLDLESRTLNPTKLALAYLFAVECFLVSIGCAYGWDLACALSMPLSISTFAVGMRS